jgi:hypothetical protein
LLILLLLLGLLLGEGKSAQDENGCRRSHNNRCERLQLLMSDTKEVLRPYGEHPIGYLQYSPGGHMVTFLSTGTPKRPAGAYTDADRADIFEGILAAYAATYRVEGNKVIHHVVASWYPERIGRDQIRFFEVDGNRLTIKTAPTTALNWNGREYVATLTFERVE